MGKLDNAIKRPVVQKLLKLIKFRNSHPAFNGVFSLKSTSQKSLIINWKNGEEWTKFNVDFNNLSYTISFSHKGKEEDLVL